MQRLTRVSWPMLWQVYPVLTHWVWTTSGWASPTRIASQGPLLFGSGVYDTVGSGGSTPHLPMFPRVYGTIGGSVYTLHCPASPLIYLALRALNKCGVEAKLDAIIKGRAQQLSLHHRSHVPYTQHVCVLTRVCRCGAHGGWRGWPGWRLGGRAPHRALRPRWQAADHPRPQRCAVHGAHCTHHLCLLTSTVTCIRHRVTDVMWLL